MLEEFNPMSNISQRSSEETHQTKEYYVIETPCGTNARFARDPSTNLFCFRRLNYHNFPAHYGFIETYDHNNKVVKTTTSDEPDFFLISNVNFTPATAVKEKDIVKLMELICYDSDTKEYDNKLIVLLKEEIDNITNKGLIFSIDSIIAFLTCMRSNFKVKDVKFYELPQDLRKIYNKDNNLVSWPTNYVMKAPNDKINKETT